MGGIPEVVIDNQTGFLVEEGDIDGMAASMTQLAKNPSLAARLGRAGRDWVSKEYSMDRCINKLSEILDESIEAHQDLHRSVLGTRLNHSAW